MEDNIDFKEICDGLFPSITNDRRILFKEVLFSYKDPPHVEKRHEQLKFVYAVVYVMPE